MNKIKTLILLTLLSSCYVEDILEQGDTFVIPENSCDCVYGDEYTSEWFTMKLRPGLKSFGWKSYNRKDYCEIVMKGYLINCK